MSRIKHFVEQENVIDRIEQVEHEIRDAARKARRAQRLYQGGRRNLKGPGI